MRKDGFKFGSGVFVCADCGKRTRETPVNSGTPLCPQCCERSMHENSHSDCDFKDDQCDWGQECPLKDVPAAERWWLSAEQKKDLVRRGILK